MHCAPELHDEWKPGELCTAVSCFAVVENVVGTWTTRRVHYLWQSVHIQSVDYKQRAQVIARTVYTVGKQCSDEFTYSVHCRRTPCWNMHVQSTPHVHSAVKRARVRWLRVYSARSVYLIHTQCISAVCFAPLSQTRCAKWTGGAPSACVECTARAPRAPKGHLCAKHSCNMQFLGTTMSCWHKILCPWRNIVPKTWGFQQFYATNCHCDQFLRVSPL